MKQRTTGSRQKAATRIILYSAPNTRRRHGFIQRGGQDKRDSKSYLLIVTRLPWEKVSFP